MFKPTLFPCIPALTVGWLRTVHRKGEFKLDIYAIPILNVFSERLYPLTAVPPTMGIKAVEPR